MPTHRPTLATLVVVATMVAAAAAALAVVGPLAAPLSMREAWRLRDKTRPRPRDYVVVGAGLPRTGTESLKRALEMLGLGGDAGSAFHMGEIIARGLERDWADVMAFDPAVGGLDDPARRRDMLEWALREYRAGVDVPVALYWRDLAHMYPHAKIILTVRDSPEAWARSINETVAFSMRCARWSSQLWTSKSWICPSLFLYFHVWPRGVLSATVRERFWSVIRAPDGSQVDLNGMQRAYTDWVEAVKRDAPRDRLLVFNVKDGWAPLVAFLGMDLPAELRNVPFPKGNDAVAMQRSYLRGTAIIGLVAFAVELLAFGVCVASVCFGSPRAFRGAKIKDA